MGKIFTRIVDILLVHGLLTGPGPANAMARRPSIPGPYLVTSQSLRFAEEAFGQRVPSVYHGRPWVHVIKAVVTGTKAPAGSPWGVYQTFFSFGRMEALDFRTLDEIRCRTQGGRGAGGRLSERTIRRDLSVLMRHGLIEQRSQGPFAEYRPLDLSAQQRRNARALLSALGARPNAALIAAGRDDWDSYLLEEVARLFKGVRVKTRTSKVPGERPQASWNARRRELAVTLPLEPYFYFDLLGCLPMDFLLSAEFDLSLLATYYGQFDKDGQHVDPEFGGRRRVISINAALPVVRNWLLDEIDELGSALRILSVGSANGGLESELVKRGHQVFGMDLLPANHTENGPILIVGDAHRMPFAAGSFDLVLFPETIGHMVIPKALDESRSLLKSSGRLVILHDVIGGSARELGWAIGRSLYKAIPIEIIGREIRNRLGFDVRIKQLVYEDHHVTGRFRSVLLVAQPAVPNGLLRKAG